MADAVPDEDKGLTEEERLVRAMERQANLVFEQRRREALQKYQQKTGQKSGFQLSQENSNSDAAIKRQLARQHEEEASSGKALPDALASQAAQKGSARSANSGGQAGARYVDNGGSGLAAYEQQMQAQQRELQKRLEEEDVRKRAELATISSSLAKYEAAADAKDKELKQRLQEEEQRKREEIAGTSAKLAKFKEQQEAEEREFRRRHEEEEQRKKEKLAAMEAADRQRRETAEARSREEEQRRRQQQEQAAVAARVRCTTCNMDLAKEQTLTVNGKPYCYGCSVAAKADKCSGCGKPILSGGMVKANAKKFHPDCLKCEKCSRVLTEGFRTRNGKMLCLQCSAGLGGN